MNRAKYILLMAMLTVACVKRPLPETEENNIPVTGDVSIQLEHTAGGKDFMLDSLWYMTANNDSVLFTNFNYYLSNFSFIAADGSEHFIKDSYFLVAEKLPASKKFTIENVPQGTYRKIKFLIGIDSTRNVSGAQTGALDPANGLFWDWNTGYIMVMAEGKSPNSQDGLFAYHLAGFKGPNKALRFVTLSLPEDITVSASHKHGLHMICDVLELFKSPNLVKMATMPVVVTEGPNVNIMADNYTDMFTIDHVE